MRTSSQGRIGIGPCRNAYSQSGCTFAPSGVNIGGASERIVHERHVVPAVSPLSRGIRRSCAAGPGSGLHAGASFRADRGAFAASGCTSLWKLMMAVAKSFASFITHAEIRHPQLLEAAGATRFRSNARGSRIFCLNHSTFECGMSWTKAKSEPRQQLRSLFRQLDSPIGRASSKPAISWQLKQP